METLDIKILKKYVSERPFLFEDTLFGIVKSQIEPYQIGSVKFQGIFWRAKVYKAECQSKLVPEQPVIVIGRDGNVLLVIPLECPIPTGLDLIVQERHTKSVG